MLEPQFLGGSPRSIFVLLRRRPDARGCVLFIPPFAEEMNNSRRQMTQTASQLVDSGYSVIVPDLFGTGDSEGDFSEATWQLWLEDISAVIKWSETQHVEVSSIVATRLGCLLAAEALGMQGRYVKKTVFWGPVVEGSDYLKSFVRIRVLASRLAGLDETVEGLCNRLADGECLEVSGYRLSAQLFAEIDARALGAVVGSHLGNVLSLAVKPSPMDKATVVQDHEPVLDNIGAVDCISGQPFWAYSEAPLNASLTERTVRFILDP